MFFYLYNMSDGKIDAFLKGKGENILKEKKFTFKVFLKAFWVFYVLSSVIITVIGADKLITKDYNTIILIL